MDVAKLQTPAVRDYIKHIKSVHGLTAAAMQREGSDGNNRS